MGEGEEIRGAGLPRVRLVPRYTLGYHQIIPPGCWWEKKSGETGLARVRFAALPDPTTADVVEPLLQAGPKVAGIASMVETSSRLGINLRD